MTDGSDTIYLKVHLHVLFHTCAAGLHPTDEALLEDEVVEQPKSKRFSL